MNNWFSYYHNWINTGVSVLALLIAAWLMTDRSIDLPILFTFFIALAMGMVALQVYTHQHAVRSEKYKTSQVHIHDAVHTIRNAYHYLELCMSDQFDIQFNKEYFKEYLISALTSANKAFELTSNVKCRTGIKLLATCSGNTKLCLTTLARDEESAKQCETIDEKLCGLPIRAPMDTVSKIMEGTINCYLSNDLSQSDEAEYFRNLQHYDDKSQHLTDDWPLPYISTVFSPIRYTPFRDELNDKTLSELEGDDMDIYYGFFSVDSKHKNVFSEAEHNMAATIADALYPLLTMYSKLEFNNK